MFRVKVGENLFSEASAPSKKAARQLAAEEAVKELMADGKLQLNKVTSEKQNDKGLNQGYSTGSYFQPAGDFSLAHFYFFFYSTFI